MERTIIDFATERDARMVSAVNAAASLKQEAVIFLDEHYSIFGPLDHFVRRKAQNKTLEATAAAPSS